MKISEFIKQLSAFQCDFGDIEVCTLDTFELLDGDYTEDPDLRYEEAMATICNATPIDIEDQWQILDNNNTHEIVIIS